MGTQSNIRGSSLDAKGFTVWFTGLPCSGKSTISRALCDQWEKMGLTRYELLDGDIVRTHISKGLGFSKEDRNTNILRIGWVAKVLTKHGVPNIVAAISPYRETRREVREMVTEVCDATRFIEVYVKCSVEVCMKRDTKGLYAAWQKGRIKGLTGLDDPYEEPEAPEIVLDTTVLDVHSEVGILIKFLKSQGLILPVEHVSP